jgi:hypothetical protein
MHGQLSAHVGKLGFCCMPYMACNFHAALNFVSRCTGGGKSRGRFVKYDKYRVFRRAFSCYVNHSCTFWSRKSKENIDCSPRIYVFERLRKIDQGGKTLF